MPLEADLAPCDKRLERSDRRDGTAAPGGTLPSRPYTPSPSPTGRRPILRIDFAVPPRPEGEIDFSHRQLAVYITLTEDVQVERDGGGIKGYDRKAAIQFCRAFATTSESWFIW